MVVSVNESKLYQFLSDQKKYNIFQVCCRISVVSLCVPWVIKVESCCFNLCHTIVNHIFVLSNITGFSLIPFLFFFLFRLHPSVFYNILILKKSSAFKGLVQNLAPEIVLILSLVQSLVKEEILYSRKGPYIHRAFDFFCMWYRARSITDIMIISSTVA